MLNTLRQKIPLLHLVGCHPGTDGGQDEDVGLPHDGHGDAKHPLNVERADEEEDGEGPVLDAHHDDVQGCEVVPPEVQVKITKDVEIVKIFKIGQLNHIYSSTSSAF